MDIDKIYEIESLDSLESYLTAIPDRDRLIERLYSQFVGYAETYDTPGQWNRAVRLCECLAITGWGVHEPVEAVKDLYVNGYDETLFVTARRESRFRTKVWPRRHDGVTLARQRNWIATNPVLLCRTLANCYANSRPFIESVITELNEALDDGMRPTLYGRAISRIIINCCLSFDDGPHCKTNYIIADESLKLRQSDYYPALLEVYTADEIEREAYFMRPRLQYGPLRRDTGCARINLHLEREFSLLTVCEQKQRFAGYVIEAVTHIADRQRRRLTYDFDQMLADFTAIVNRWAGI